MEHLIGNEENKQLLQKIIETNNIVHSYMFVGKEGIGKQEFAKAFAKKILCLGDTEEKKCKSCLEFESSNHPDFLILDAENGTIKIEQIRKLISKAIEKPIISQKKVYIINDADYMTKEAQNCLLKTLEEPPEYLEILLIVQNESQILTTIKSRCTKITFKQIEDDVLKDYLEKEHSFENLSSGRLKSFERKYRTSIKMERKRGIIQAGRGIF